MNSEPPIRLCVKCRKKPAVTAVLCSRCLIRLRQGQRTTFSIRRRSFCTKTARAEFLLACGQPLR